MPSPPPLAVQLLGGFAVRVAGRDVPASAWQQRRAAAVVKLLALQPQYRLHREVLMETLWPDLDGEPAANNLRVAMHRARQRLEDAGASPGRFLTRQQDDVVLADPAEVVVDVQRFSESAQRAWLKDDPALTHAAAALYTGDLLPEDPYEEWAAHRRTDLRITYLALLSRLAQLHEARADDAAAIAATQQLLAAEPLDEAAHASLMRRFARVGAYRQALAQYDALAALLAQELDAEPEATTVALRDEIQALAQANANQPPLVAPAPLVASTPDDDIPAELPLDADLIGRERELAELTRVLERHRLVTLVGPAGVGKTRLAEAMYRAKAAQGRQGQVIELAAVTQPDLLLGALANALGATEPETDPTWETLAAHIGQRNLLLVLDNFEQILDAAPLVADLLRACPRLAIMVTSRERLRLRAEHVYHVAPLALPALASPAEDALASYPAVRLFLQRATSTDSAFYPTETELRAIAEICQRVDGLPLAIELAAARVRVLPPVALLSQMARPLPLLVGGPRDAPARQRTMRAAIAWSVDLLAADSRELFQRLACFPDSFSLPAVQHIADPEMAPAEPGLSPLLDVLEDLLDAHLLRRIDADPGTPRFSMLTVVREYARELLDASPGALSIRARHASFFQALATEQAPLLTTENAGAALAMLEQEHPSLRTAIVTLLDRGDADSALMLATDLWRFWLLRGHLSEGRAWLAQGLDATGDSGPPRRGAALDADGVLAFAQGDFMTARHRHLEALEIAREIGDSALAARALVNLGAVADEQGLPEQAAEYLEEALRVSRAIGDQRAIAVALANLGQVAISLAEYARAADLLNESVLAFRALGDPRSEAAILANLGLMSLMTGDAAVARHCHQEALRVFRELGDGPAEAAELLNLGHATQLLGDWVEAEMLYGQAREYFSELGDRSGVAFAELHLGKLALLRAEHDLANAHLVLALETAQEIGDWVATAESLEGLAMLFGETGVPVLAARSLGAAEELRHSLGLPLPAIHRAALTSSLQRLESVLSITELAEARAAGASQFRRHFAAIQTGNQPSPLFYALAAGNSSAA
jgi:predicted ATPase/DNA-binding SARP family transcriptional activator